MRLSWLTLTPSKHVAAGELTPACSWSLRTFLAVSEGDRLVAVGWMQSLGVLCLIHRCSGREEEELVVSI